MAVGQSWARVDTLKLLKGALHDIASDEVLGHIILSGKVIPPR